MPCPSATEDSTRVPLNRLKQCPAPVTEEFRPPRRQKRISLLLNQEGNGEDAYEPDSQIHTRVSSTSETCNSHHWSN